MTKEALSSQHDEHQIQGGMNMEAKDAIRIARLGKFGDCYEPSEQLPHGGMKFTGFTDVPHYNPGTSVSLRF